jgi:hypothetical protein
MDVIQILRPFLVWAFPIRERSAWHQIVASSFACNETVGDLALPFHLGRIVADV